MLLNCGIGEDLRVPWTARGFNQSILKEISPGFSLEGLTLKLKFQYLGTWCEELIHWKRPWCLARFKAGGEGNDRGWDGWMASPPQWTWVWVSSGSWWWTGEPGVLQSMGLQRVGHYWATELRKINFILMCKDSQNMQKGIIQLKSKKIKSVRDGGREESWLVEVNTAFESYVRKTT